MRILTSADIHGCHDVYDWLVKIAHAREPSAVILAGDLLGYPDGYETPESAQEADRDIVLATLSALSCPLLYIMGNDDWVELRSGVPGHRSLHSDRFDLGEFNFVGYQFTLPFMGGINERPESEIELDLMALESRMDSHTVLVTHGPAYGILDAGILDEPVGSKSLSGLFDRRPPRAHVHGHIHSQFGRRGRHFNVASGGRKRAMMIDLDTMEHEVLAEGGLPRP